MKTLLRSTFRDGPSDDPALLMSNLQSLRDAGLMFDVAEDVVLWKFVGDFADQYHHVPEAGTIRSHFESTRQMEVVDRLDALRTSRAKIQGDFLRHLEIRAEEKRTRVVSEVLREAGRIVEVGIRVKEGREEKLKKGPIDAIRYVMECSAEIVTPTSGARLSGDATSDGASFVAHLERVESDPLAGIGQHSGITQMDSALGGARRGELWVHTAFTGGLKSTLAMNWAYNQSVYYRHSSIFFSLEMPYLQCRNILYAMHSGHEKFEASRRRLGVMRSVEYKHIRDGQLTPGEREFLLDIVVPDFNDPENHYGSIHIEVADPDKTDFTIIDLRSRGELLYSKDPAIRLIIVDHAGLMASRNKYPSTTERQNEVLRDLKRMAGAFNRGMGIAVLALHQINREGYKAAEKNGGKYNLTHLSYANECERSSDVVTAAWIDDDLRGRNLLKLQCLKSRDDSPFSDFYAGVVWPCRRILTVNDVPTDRAKKAGDDIDLSL